MSHCQILTSFLFQNLLILIRPNIFKFVNPTLFKLRKPSMQPKFINTVLSSNIYKDHTRSNIYKDHTRLLQLPKTKNTPGLTFRKFLTLDPVPKNNEESCVAA